VDVDNESFGQDEQHAAGDQQQSGDGVFVRHESGS
jgi:hypothetical protein